jgi:uncharacterized cysteine cluster protein YcgN (CxxCxxCC family)
MAAIPINGIPVVLTGIRCMYLNKESEKTWRCSVYENRFSIAPWCLNLSDAARTGALSQDCPYVSLINGYSGKKLVSEGILRKYLHEIMNDFQKRGIADWVDIKSVHDFFSEFVPEKKFEIFHDIERKRFLVSQIFEFTQ